MRGLVCVAAVVLAAGMARAQGGVPHSGIGPCPSGQAVIRLNANGPPTCGAVEGVTTYTFATLPGSCTTGTVAYCSDCMNVSDGVTASSTAIGNGTGALVDCKSNVWKVAP
jgi:hypothetical protein